jgi:hypothetical protein
MTLSWPSFLAAAIRAFMPPPAATELTVAQLVLLVLLLLVLPLLLLELDELQAAVRTRPLATAAPTASTFLARTISLPSTVPGIRDPRSHMLARQVEIMTSQDKREVSSPWRPGIRYESDW